MDLRTIQSVNFHPGRLLRFARKAAWFFKVYLPPEHHATVLTRNGLLTVNSKDKTTGRILHVHRNHEFEQMMRYVDLLEKEGFLERGKGIVLDVGGNIGMSSTTFLLENIYERAVAFEPSPGNFELLCKNIHNNNLEGRMIGHNMALSDQEGELTLELSEKNYGDHRIRTSENVEPGAFNEQHRHVIRIAARTFDSLTDEELSVPRDQIKLVWMDIQGHEAHFMKGAQTFLKQHPHVPVIMEYWPYAMKRAGITSEDFSNLVSSLFKGYYTLTETGYEFHSVDEIRENFEKCLADPNPNTGNTLVFANPPQRS